MTALIDDATTVTILRAYARGLEIRHVPSATGLHRDLVLDVVERVAGNDRGYAQQLLHERDTQTTRTTPTSPTVEAHRARTSTPAISTPAAAAATAPARPAPPAPDRAEPAPGPRRRGRHHPADPAAPGGDAVTAVEAAPAARTVTTAPVVETTPDPTPAGDVAAAPPPTGTDTVEQLIAAAVASPRQRTRTLAARVRQLLTELREQVDADAATREAEDRVTALRAELARAEAQLRDARRSVTTPAGPTSAEPPAPAEAAEAVDVRVVRRWALDNGVECNTQGRVPGRVVDAWRAATGKTV